jgi:hypothetical protein
VVSTRPTGVTAPRSAQPVTGSDTVCPRERGRREPQGRCPDEDLASLGPLAQLAEQRTFNPRVVGSIPTGPTKPQVSDLTAHWQSAERNRRGRTAAEVAPNVRVKTPPRGGQNRGLHRPVRPGRTAPRAQTRPSHHRHAAPRRHLRHGDARMAELVGDHACA